MSTSLKLDSSVTPQQLQATETVNYVNYLPTSHDFISVLPFKIFCTFKSDLFIGLMAGLCD